MEKILYFKKFKWAHFAFSEKDSGRLSPYYRFKNKIKGSINASFYSPQF